MTSMNLPPTSPPDDSATSAPVWSPGSASSGTCTSKNPYTGDCSCPSGFSADVLTVPDGTGAVLLGLCRVASPDLADYELRQVWCRDPRPRLDEARRRLGLEMDAETGVLTLA